MPANSNNGVPPPQRTGGPPAGNGVNGGAADLSDRLNGWKEIASYLGKGVRTAQRWERQFGMPIHRIGGEVVFALRSEIDAWSTAKSGQRGQNGTLSLPADANGEAEDSDDGPRLALTARLRRVVIQRPHVAALAMALTGVLVTVIAWVVDRWMIQPAASPPHVVDVRLAGIRLEALDGNGRELWSHSFPEHQEPHPKDHPHRHLRLVITDLTGDGRPEVVYTATNHQTGTRLFVFNSDGSVRFDHQWTGAVRFGSQDYQGPFHAMWVWVTRGSDGAPTIWLSSRHRVEFPSVLERLDVTGRVTGEYWQGGEVTAVAAGRLGDRDVVLAGGVANEGHGASLAVFDTGTFGGSAPGPDEKHTCASCPPGQPQRFFIFPPDEVIRVLYGESDVTGITMQSDGAVTVAVRHGTVPDTLGRMTPAITDYTFDAHFTLQRAGYSHVYRLVHDLLFKRGTLDHPFSQHQTGLLVPIREWRDGRFVEVWAKDGDRGPGTGDQLRQRPPNPAP
jgi:hypothetical protein